MDIKLIIECVLIWADLAHQQVCMPFGSILVCGYVVFVRPILPDLQPLFSAVFMCSLSGEGPVLMALAMPSFWWLITDIQNHARSKRIYYHAATPQNTSRGALI